MGKPSKRHPTLPTPLRLAARSPSPYRPPTTAKKRSATATKNSPELATKDRTRRLARTRNGSPSRRRPARAGSCPTRRTGGGARNPWAYYPAFGEPRRATAHEAMRERRRDRARRGGPKTGSAPTGTDPPQEFTTTPKVGNPAASPEITSNIDGPTGGPTMIN